MSEFGVWFKHEKMLYKFPVNPEEIEINAVQAVTKYEVLKLGQIAVPTHMELIEYSFEAEFPHVPYHWVETAGSDKKQRTLLNKNYYIKDAKDTKDFKNADYYLNTFKEWREKLIPVLFIVSNGIGEEIITPVLIEELTILEKAGEEGDKYVKFKLLEYKNHGAKPADEIIYTLNASRQVTAKKKTSTSVPQVSGKSSGSYVVQSGDSLWSIAKKYYGDGSKCNIIYNANKNIKSPVLIYPGQNLKIPPQSDFSKYSAPLPTEKVSTKVTPKKTNSTHTAYEQGVAGIALLLDGMGTRRSHSSGGRSF